MHYRGSLWGPFLFSQQPLKQYNNKIILTVFPFQKWRSEGPKRWNSAQEVAGQGHSLMLPDLMYALLQTPQHTRLTASRPSPHFVRHPTGWSQWVAVSPLDPSSQAQRKACLKDRLSLEGARWHLMREIFDSPIWDYNVQERGWGVLSCFLFPLKCWVTHSRGLSFVLLNCPLQTAMFPTYSYISFPHTDSSSNRHLERLEAEEHG